MMTPFGMGATGKLKNTIPKNIGFKTKTFEKNCEGATACLVLTKPSL